MKRTDKFRPSVIDPSKFIFICDVYHGNSDDMDWSWLSAEYEAYEAHKRASGGSDANHGWKGKCDCCGAKYLYGAKFYSAEDNVYIEVGGICAGKMNLRHPAAMKTFRERVNTWKLHQEKLAAIKGAVEQHNLRGALAYYQSNDNSQEFPERTIRDIIGKLISWGEISDAQVAFVHKLEAQIADRPRLEAERAAKDAARKPLPLSDKRITIEGVIISAKYQDGGWTNGFFRPAAVKVVVEHVDGWRVWGSLPSDLWEDAVTYSEPSWHNGAMVSDGRDINSNKIKGRTIRFDARVTVSEKDDKFGFFKRPTKAAYVTVASVTNIEEVAA